MGATYGLGAGFQMNNSASRQQGLNPWLSGVQGITRDYARRHGWGRGNTGMGGGGGLGQAGMSGKLQSALNEGPPSTGLDAMSWGDYYGGVPNVPDPNYSLMNLNSAVPEDPTRAEAMKLYERAGQWAPEAKQAAQSKANELQRSYEHRMKNVGGGVSKLARMSQLAEHRRGLHTDLQSMFSDLTKAGLDMESAKLAAVTAMDTQRRAHGLQQQSLDLQRQIAQQQAKQGRADSYLRAKAQWVNAELARAQTDANLQAQWIDSMLRYQNSLPRTQVQYRSGGGGQESGRIDTSSQNTRRLGQPGGGAGYTQLGTYGGDAAYRALLPQPAQPDWHSNWQNRNASLVY